nr:hypothetical protein [Bacteroides congonensis]
MNDSTYKHLCTIYLPSIRQEMPSVSRPDATMKPDSSDYKVTVTARPSFSGVTGPVYLDAYKLNGKQLWRIDLGKNIRAGSHYTQFDGI